MKFQKIYLVYFNKNKIFQFKLEKFVYAIIEIKTF